MLVSLANVTSSSAATIPTTALPPDLQAHMVIPLGFVAVESSLVAHRPLNSTVQRSSTPHPPGAAAAPAMAILRATDHVLAFLDHKYWVCTFTLSETRPGRVKRHFFLPRDWLNMDWLELAVMRPDGVLLCPRNGEVALVENGLREEWMD